MLLKSTYRMPRADNNGFAGIANFLFRHAAEERNHDENTGIYFK
jgi:ferritin